MAIDLNGIASWLHGWFPYHSEVVAKNQTSANASKNLVTDVDGEVSLENKVSVGSGLSFDGNVENKINHSNSISAQTSAVFKKIKYDAQGHITGTANVTASDLPNIDATNVSYNDTYASGINTVDDALYDLDDRINNLSSINAIQVVSTLPTASASTMGKLYIISENSKINVYYTITDGQLFEWHKMDADILDELSINWNDITGKPSTFTPSSHTHTESEITDLDIPSNTSDLVNDGSDGSSIYVESAHLPIVARTGEYIDLLNIPTDFTPSSHTHGNISNEGKIGTSASKIITTGTGGVLQASSSIPVARVSDSNAHVNIGTSANTLQSAINTGIDTAIGNLKTSKQDKITSIALIPKTDNGNGKIVFYTGDEPT